MKITGLEIEGFGVWSGLHIETLGDSLNVLYGPNEAGKTTLLQFIRSMLYGLSPQRRRYLPPVHGGHAGGAVELSGPHGQFQVARRYSAPADGESAEQVTLTAPDGTRQGEHFIKVLLSNVDEPVFNNIFAVGLREIQELATLGDTEAADLLYSLSIGMDRVSLVEVMRELEASRNRIIDRHGKPCQITQLLAEREKLQATVDELQTANHRYGRLAAERQQIERDSSALEEEINRLERAARVMDLALMLRDRWRRRAVLQEELSSLESTKLMPPRAVERFDAINARLQRHQQRIQRLVERHRQARLEYKQLAVNDSLRRQAARIEVLAEQEPWISQLAGQLDALQQEIVQIESELSAERQRLGLKSSLETLPMLSAGAIKGLRGPARAVSHAHRLLAEARQAEAAARHNAEGLAAQIKTALSARGEHDLPTAMDRTGGLVAQLRRRVQLDERIEQLAQYQTDLEQRCRDLVDRQLLPAGVLAGLGAAFVLGVVLILTGLFMPESIVGSAGWTLAILGLAGSGAAAFGKWMLERSNVHQLDACEKQLAILRLQFQQANEDRTELDRQLSTTGGGAAARLAAAEQQLAALEELVPLETRRNSAVQESESAARRIAEIGGQLAVARQRWREALAQAGLPDTLTPKQLQRLTDRGDRLAELNRRLDDRREELARRRRELESFSTRIAQVANEAGLPQESGGPVDLLRRLVEAASHQQAAITRRDSLRSQCRRIKATCAKHKETVAALLRRRRQLLILAGVADQKEFRRLALDAARADALRADYEAISRDIYATIAGHCTEAAIEQHLTSLQAETLEARREDTQKRLATMQHQLRELAERRGCLSEQLTAAAADRRLPEAMLDLALVEQRLADAAQRWRVLAVAYHILETVRNVYETQRQPETLREASVYLDRLTQGRYCRVWTPLGEPVLRVDDAQGNSLSVDVLSRGTREQLFLSLRLALASSYARRGACLPLVLDDVLVNFDSERAKAAAAVIRDYAASGHQMLVLTCHEHIMKLFSTLGVPVGQLPDNSTADEKTVRFECQAQTRQSQPVPEDTLPSESKSARVKPAVRSKRRAAPPASQSRVFDADFFDSDEEAISEHADQNDNLLDEDTAAAAA